MTRERYKHILLDGPTQTLGFTNPIGGGSSSDPPPRNRREHSAYLKQRFEETWSRVKDQQAVVHTERQGAYIEFVSEPGFDLALKSLEFIKSNIRLRNVRTEGEEESQRTLATVYVPNEKRALFLRKIEKYATEIDKRSNKPKNLKLINSISDIRLAVLESFWREDEQILIPQETLEWVEVWLSSDLYEVIIRFETLLNSMGIVFEEGYLQFPERSVKLIYANREQLEKLILHSDDVAEMRVAKEVASFFIEQENRDQIEQVRTLLARTSFIESAEICICILDTGINNGHLLIQPVLDDSDLHTVRQEWGIDDHEGHGTLMAGIATYGDLLNLLNSNEQIQVVHRLESVKILPPHGSNPKKLWGHITAQGISLAEIQSQRKRIICLAITSTDNRNRGRPSSWSGALDRLTSGYLDDAKRLIIVSAGNVDNPDNWRHYPDDNLTNEIHDPGQAWNALTVGAFTEKIDILDSTFSGFTPVAQSGGLSPYSTTSTSWLPGKWPIKPEIVVEGGNVARGPNNSMLDPEDLSLLSTYYKPHEAQFAPFGQTSAASAQAAWMAAQIQAQYPNYWPETIRALLVHSAEWPEEIIRQFNINPERKTGSNSIRTLLSICGYGVPNLDNALYCASNSLTLIAQNTLQPFDKRGYDYITRDMHLFNLPWPSSVLEDLGEIPVRMKVTLSYFVEPSPGDVGSVSRYRYASHALRFDVNGPGEIESEFVQRVNKQARDDGEYMGTEGSGQYWKIGQSRNVGSIHSDIWEGRAVDLSRSNLIAVYPAGGWWKERHHLNRWNREARYSLVVSIMTSEQEVDIYTPVAVLVGVPIPIDIST